MNLIYRLFKFFQSEAHSFLNRFEDPVKLIEQGIRDLKKDFDDSMKSIAEVKAISIGAKQEIASKKQIAIDYEQKAMIILKKAQNNELEEAEADRLAGEALKKAQEAKSIVVKLTNDVKAYDSSIAQMEKKVLELKNQIKKSEDEYKTLKARATVAKTTKKINKQLSTVSSDSTMALIEEMKIKIQEEENLAQAYGEIAQVTTSIDDEINNAIGTDLDVQKSLAEMKQKLLSDTSTAKEPSIEDMKKQLET